MLWHSHAKPSAPNIHRYSGQAFLTEEVCTTLGSALKISLNLGFLGKSQNNSYISYNMVQALQRRHAEKSTGNNE